ncbi:MutS-related protein [Helcococcus ovis]|uniref:MutS-related protein n=1 Tax=Helcococcus ovis TaxID=72026 RepID=UPI0038BCC281
MENLTEIFIFLAISASIIIFSAIANYKYIIKKISSSWGKYRFYEFSPPENEEFLNYSYYTLKKYSNSNTYIDDLTWNDLDMTKIFNKINTTYSSVGSAILYYRLRNLNPSKEDKEIFENIQNYYSKYDKDRIKTQYNFYKLGKFENNKVLEFVDNAKSKKFYEVYLYIILGLLPIFILLGYFFISETFIAFLLPSLAINAGFSYYKKLNTESDFNNINYIISVVKTAKKISKFNLQITNKIKQNISKLNKLTKMILVAESHASSSVDFLAYFLNKIFMTQLIFHKLALKEISKNKTEIFDLWKNLGDVESGIAILNFKNIVKNYCIPSFSKKYEVYGKNIYHPLIKNPIKNDVDWKENILISGSNASGKSTYVKSVAINIIFSQTIYMALASEFILKPENVLTSMAIKDNIDSGESYFIAEIKSLKRIMDDIAINKSYYFIDEILKGTNTTERIAASSSIIEYFIDKNVLSFIATHDIELTQKFENKLVNLHFRESFTDNNNLIFDYNVHKGASKTKNAIKLLEIMNFPKEILENSKKEVLS